MFNNNRMTLDDGSLQSDSGGIDALQNTRSQLSRLNKRLAALGRTQRLLWTFVLVLVLWRLATLLISG